MDEYKFIATAAFGLEATVKREIIRLGFSDIKVSDGRVDFTGGPEAFAKCNIGLRASDRLLLVIGEFGATTFDELFEAAKALPWGDWITEDGKFTVTGKSVRSRLHSVPDVQSIVKKAVVEKLKQKYHVEWFVETGSEYKIQAAILNDRVTLTIDTTGASLHKRGYRLLAVPAPLKETVAYALIELSYWRKDRILLDPLCGSGTIPIEAALAARNVAPGLYRNFVCEKWPRIPKNIFTEAREEAREAADHNFMPEIFGSDRDEKAIEAAEANAAKAGVADCVRFEARPLSKVTLPGNYGVAICNPPYGERIGDKKEVDALYREMGKLFNADRTWSAYALTADEDFELSYGRRADAKRKLYNGTIKTDYYQFNGPRPPK